jgi:hypothetical protein
MEADLLAELRAFLCPFKTFTDIVSCNKPTLSLVPLMKMKIRKQCEPNISDDSSIATIKRKILARLDVRFPESDITLLHQLLDPDTKDLISRQDGTRLLETAIKDCVERQFIQQQVIVVEQSSSIIYCIKQL